MGIAVLFPVVAPAYVAKGMGRPFGKVENREVFLRSVEVYAQRDEVTQRIVISTPDDLEIMQQKYAAHLGFQGVNVVGGTSDWFGCVARGLARLDADVDTVFVHDVSCPAVGFLLIEALEEALAKNKGCAGVVPVLPARSGFADLEAGGGVAGGAEIREYVDMAKVHEVQSPQLFRRKALEEAYGKRGTNTFVDDAELLLTLGHKLTTVAGSRLNQRIDTDDMLRLAKDLIAHVPRPKPKTPLNPFDEAQW
jgi:2-C-methyl-D-erythritol 4-phosphate cytidylyltransferase